MTNNNKTYKLREYIDEFFGGNQAAFARDQGVERPQVTQWLNKNFIVVENVLYSPRRSLTLIESSAVASLDILSNNVIDIAE